MLLIDVNGVDVFVITAFIVADRAAVAARMVVVSRCCCCFIVACFA